MSFASEMHQAIVPDAPPAIADSRTEEPDARRSDATGSAVPEEQLRLQALHQVQRLRACDAVSAWTWVCTDLSTIQLTGPELHPEDIVRGSQAYRRLSPDFFLWLEGRFNGYLAKPRQDDKAKANAALFQERFRHIQTVAKALFTPEQFNAARDRLAALAMESPNRGTVGNGPLSSFEYPEQSGLRFHKLVTHHALAEVDVIREDAVAAGWTLPELYQTRGQFCFPYGPHYGLVCFIRSDQRLGPVTADSIEVRCRGGHSLRFHRRCGQ